MCVLCRDCFGFARWSSRFEKPRSCGAWWTLSCTRQQRATGFFASRSMDWRTTSEARFNFMEGWHAQFGVSHQTLYCHCHRAPSTMNHDSFMSDEDICRLTSQLPDAVLLQAFDKPLHDKLTKLSLVRKTVLRVRWFNPNRWSTLEPAKKIKFIQFLLLNNSSTQHEIAKQLRDAVIEAWKTLCGYNAVKGACTTTTGMLSFSSSSSTE